MLSTAAENRHNFAAPTTREIMQKTSIAILKISFSKNHSETVQKFAVRTTRQKSFERTAKMNEGKGKAKCGIDYLMVHLRGG